MNIQTQERFQQSLFRSALLTAALFVSASIHPTLGLLIAALWGLIVAIGNRGWPSIKGNGMRFFIVALTILSNGLGLLLTAAIIYIALRIATDEKHLRSAYGSYLEQESTPEDHVR